MRFALAAFVLLSHSYILGGFGKDDPITALSRGQISLGSLGVDGFFVISGYLITRSYLSSPSTLNYLWRRFLRIFPGFWVCLLVTAFIFAPVAYLSEHGTLTGAGWLGDDQSPIGYILHNATLVVYQWNIWHLFLNSPLAAVEPPTFDGSLWTLRFEFDAYVFVAILGVTGLLRRFRIVMLVSVVFLWLGLVAYTYAPAVLARVPSGLGVRWLFYEPNRPNLYMLFGIGALLYLYADRLPMRGRFSALAWAGFGASFLFGGFNLVGEFAYAYCCLWLAVSLPVRRFDTRGDFSYGIYIYAFPIQQLLALWGVNRWGWTPFTLLTFIVTMAFAISSWYFVEAPAQRLKRLNVAPKVRLTALLALGRRTLRLDRSTVIGNRHATLN